MITLGANLTNQIKAGGNPFWAIKLFYNAEGASDWVGISDTDRIIGGDQYIGAATWGTLNQSADLENFTAQSGRMVLTVNNTIKAFAGKRFTDLLATKNFANRKWEMYLGVAGTLSTETIQQGRVIGDIEGDDLKATINMMDMTSKFDIEIPNADTSTSGIVNTSDHPNAPEKNIGQPIPMAWGDFDRNTSSTDVNLDRHDVKSHFPAVITDAVDIDAAPDIESLNTLRTRNVYMSVGDAFAACDPANVTATAATPIITFGGATWYVPMKIVGHFPSPTYGSNLDNLYDRDESTSGVVETDANGDEVQYFFHLEPMSVQGVVASIKAYIDISAFTISVDTSHDFVYFSPVNISATKFINPATGVQTFTFASGDATSAEIVLPGADAFLQISPATAPSAESTADLTIDEILLEAVISPQETFTKFIKKEFVIRRQVLIAGISSAATKPPEIRRIADEAVLLPSGIDYIYYSGQGRKYGAWIDADSGATQTRVDVSGVTDPGYNSGTLIQNPIYIVEDMLRTAGQIDGLTPALWGTEIDFKSFDTSANTTNGYIGDTFNDAVADIKFALCQHKFISVMDFASKIGSQCGTIFFVSGSGKIKSATRRRASDYSSADVLINYADITVISTTLTPVNAVRNDIEVSYGWDYALEQTTGIGSGSADATSKGSSVSGYNQTLRLKQDLPSILDSTTANAYEDALLDFYKDRKNEITFESSNALHQAVEVGDVINFSDWPSDYKVNNTTIADAPYFMVIETSKKGPELTRVTARQVS